MVYKVFLDTNIIIDYFMESRNNHEQAILLFSKMIDKNIKAYTSETVINTSCYLLAKYIQPKKLSEYFDEMLTFIEILPSNNNTFHKAYLLNYQDLEDAVLFQIAFENSMDFFISSDKPFTKNMTSKKLPIIEIKQLLSLL
jgi:putative PIN family toxin of toxin-antitoxin system